MRLQKLLLVAAAILLAPNIVNGAAEQELYRYVVVSEGTEQQLQYILYLNTSSTKVGGDMLDFQHVEIKDFDPSKMNDEKNRLCAILDGNADFLVSVAKSESVMNLVKAVASQSKIPTFQVDYMPWTYQRPDLAVNMTSMENMTSSAVAPLPPPTDGNYITLVPPTTVIMSILLDFVPKVNISKHIRVLYDDSFNLNDTTWQDMMKLVPNVVFTMEPMKTNETEMPKQIDTLSKIQGPDNMKIKSLLLMASTPNIEKFISSAKDFMDKKRFDWFVLTKDVRAFQCEVCTTVNALWMRPDNGDEAFQRIRDFKQYLYEILDMTDMISGDTEVEASFFLDMTFMAWDYVLSVNSSTDFYVGYGCENQTATGNRTISLVEFMELAPEGSYGPYIPTDDKSTTKYFQDVIMRLVQIAFEKDDRMSKSMGNWTIKEGITEHYDSLMQDITKIKKYRVSIVVQPPFIEKYKTESGVWSYRGYCIDLIKKISEIVSFEYDMYEVKDKMYGAINDQGEWNGLIGELISGEADIALAPLSVMAERENFVDFTVPYYDLVGTTILMRKQEVSYSLFKFMTVLEPPVWGCIVGAYFFTSFLLWIFDRFSPYSYTNNKEKYKDDPEKREFTFKECLWFCMTSLTPQGGGEAPKNISGRLVAATWWLFGFIIIASYTANLAAFLTVSRLETPISSLDDLAKQYKIKYAPVKGTASETYFRRMAEIEERFYDIWKAMSLNESMTPQERAQLAVWDYPVSDKFTNMWRYMQEAGLPNTTEDAIDRVLASESATEGFAFIGDATEIRYAELTDCRLQAVGNEFSRKPYAIAVQQGSRLKDQISSAILKLLNQRELEHLKEKWWNQNPNRKDCPKMEDESDGISIQNIGGVFIVILVGIALSIVTLAFEYWYYKDKPRKGEGPDTNGAPRTGINQISTVQVGNGNNNELKEINANGGMVNGGNVILSGQYNTAYDTRE